MSEKFVTTVVGSMPKPAWLMEQLPLNAEGKQVHGKGADWMFKGDLLETSKDDATRLTLHDQIHAGIDVVSDGEQRRTSYLTYITSRLEGFDYETLTKKWTRNNRRLAEVGRCIGPVRRKGPMLKRDAEFMLAEQIQAAPDCGLVPLSLDIARAKLKAMVEGAQLARERLG